MADIHNELDFIFSPSPFLFQIPERGRGPHLGNVISFLSDGLIPSFSASSTAAIIHQHHPITGL